jgi:hypothetical protein
MPSSPVSQPDVPLVSAPPLDISHHARPPVARVDVRLDVSSPACNRDVTIKRGDSDGLITVTGRYRDPSAGALLSPGERSEERPLPWRRDCQYSSESGAAPAEAVGLLDASS